VKMLRIVVIFFKKACVLALMMTLSVFLILSLPQNVLGEDTSTATGSSTGTISKSVVANEANAKTTQKTEEDPRKRQQQDDWVDATGAFQYKYPLNLP
jgi:hypothetical protein